MKTILLKSGLFAFALTVLFFATGCHHKNEPAAEAPAAEATPAAAPADTAPCRYRPCRRGRSRL